MDLGKNLFGEPVLQRSAIFADGNRISLSRSWSPGPSAYIIGHNPSDAGVDRDDPTTNWLIAWCRWFGFGGYDLGNLYPFVTSDPRECHRVVAAIPSGNWHDRDALWLNTDAVRRAAKAADRVFVCWGAIASDQDWVEHIIEEIQQGEEPWPDMWCWGINADGSPKHPMARGKHRIPSDQQPILWRAR